VASLPPGMVHNTADHRTGGDLLVGRMLETDVAHVQRIVPRRRQTSGDLGRERVVNKKLHDVVTSGSSRSRTLSAANRRASRMSSASSIVCDTYF
jgi:hypothetical protein